MASSSGTNSDKDWYNIAWSDCNSNEQRSNFRGIGSTHRSLARELFTELLPVGNRAANDFKLGYGGWAGTKPTTFNVTRTPNQKDIISQSAESRLTHHWSPGSGLMNVSFWQMFWAWSSLLGLVSRTITKEKWEARGQQYLGDKGGSQWSTSTHCQHCRCPRDPATELDIISQNATVDVQCAGCPHPSPRWRRRQWCLTAHRVRHTCATRTGHTPGPPFAPQLTSYNGNTMI